MTDRLCSFRVSIRRVLIVVLGVPTCFCIGIPSARGGNLIANGSFESYGGTGFPSNIGAGLPGWTIQGGPNFANSLGATLSNMAIIDRHYGRFDKARDKITQALAWQRKALATNPNSPLYRRFLASTLKNMVLATEGPGHADEAEQAQRELAKLQDSDPRIVALDARLAAVLEGKEAPNDDRERIQLAWHVYTNSLNIGSARLYAEALANDPKLADDR
jgi:tetratricopeptide (TPR) repeat protein